MQIYPAIDILNGNAVRLQQGDYNKVTVFEKNPIDAAEKWIELGASFIHLVDLDGARHGKSFISEIIKSITEKFDIKIQIGGGIRSLDDIDEKIKAGVSRVIIGTAAVKNPELVRQAVKKYGDKIAVGVDAKNGCAAVSGWEEVSNITALELCCKMKDIGVKTIIYTDISKDGMMEGPNIEATKELIDKTGLDIIASGGISSIKDLENIKEINASGAILGKSLYNGNINLSDAVRIFEKGE